MIDRIIHFSIYNRLLIGLFVGALVLWGTYSLVHLPIDAVPDITDNQVQIITSAPDLSAQEVERFITYPLELELGNVPDVEEIRSISRIGLSVITVVFVEQADIYWARQQIHQKIQRAKEEIPPEFGIPEMGPISTGLGEVYQYVIYPEEGYEEQFDPTELRTIQDWIIKRQLLGIPGVVEVNSSGGFLKQFEISVDIDRLQAFNLTMSDLIHAVEKNNENTGGSYIERHNYVYFIRGEGMITDTNDLQNIYVKNGKEGPLLLKDVANVKIGKAPRFGAVTMNGRGEVVAGQVMMLKGANSMEVVQLIKERMVQIAESLPEGVAIEPYLDRSKLINQTTSTIITNLLEGALIVLFILVVFLGNFRAGLIVASVIPLSMLFAIGLMSAFGVSANLMSLGAIDFGLIVDGAVIIVESILFQLGVRRSQILPGQFDARKEVYLAASNIRKSAAFGEIIILIVYLPILFLQGVEGKMFQPMAQTVSFAILGALILSLTYVPMMSAIFLKNSQENRKSIGHRIFSKLQSLHEPLLRAVIKVKYGFLLAVLIVFVLSLFTLSRMGGEFIPTLEEGDFALHQILPAGASIKKGVDVSAKLQDILTSNFPEVEKVVTKIGTPEIPTDIMPMEAGDIFVIMKPKSEWTSARTRDEMFEKMKIALEKFPGVIYEFTQPIQMRFNELMTGVRQDIAIKIYGENLGELYNIAKRAESLIGQLPGAGDIQVERTGGLQYLEVKYNRQKLASYGIAVSEVSNVIKTAFAGRVAGSFYEGERKFDIVVRLDSAIRQDVGTLAGIMVPTQTGGFVPLAELAAISFEQGPSQISRDDTKRRITIGINARNVDVATLIEEIEHTLEQDLQLPAGYHIRYGGQFENLERARARLSLVVPVALLLIFILLYLTFNSVKYALLIYVAIPLSAIGGIWALYLRGMPFSISAGVGFIALFGVAVLNGIVLVGYFNQLRREGLKDVYEIIMKGTRVRLRPVLLTASVASLGFLPMALSHSAGAEVQRPLATVVIGGLITATILTLFVIPLLYQFFEKNVALGSKSGRLNLLLIMVLIPFGLRGQGDTLGLDQAIEMAMLNSSRPQVFEKKAAAWLSQMQDPVAPLPISVGVTSDEFDFSNQGVHSLYVGKSFRTGNLGGAYKKLFEGQGELMRARGLLDRQLTSHAVGLEYLALAWLMAEIDIESRHDSVMQALIDVLSRHVDLGIASSLPLQQAKLRRSILQNKLDHLMQEYAVAKTLFAEWINRQDYHTFPLSKVAIMDTLIDESHPRVKTLESQAKVLMLQNQVIDETAKPSIVTQLRFQAVDGSIPFLGYQIGLGIPLNGKYNEGRKMANQLNTEAVRKELENVQWQLNRQSVQINAKKAAQEIALERLEYDLMPTAQSILDNYRRAFDQGEVQITDVFLMQDKLIELQQEYLQVRYKYLINQLNAKFPLIENQ